MNRKFGLLFALMLAGLMAACSPAAGSQPTEDVVTEEPTVEVTDEPTEAAPEVEETEAPADEAVESDVPAVLAAQDALADHLGVDASALVLVSAEQVEWTDGCLGLGGAAEMCMQALVPGWRVIFSADGTEYEVRTDETGASVRINLGDAGSVSPTE